MLYFLLNLEVFLIIVSFLLGILFLALIPSEKIKKPFEHYSTEQWDFTRKKILPFYALLGACHQYILFWFVDFQFLSYVNTEIQLFFLVAMGNLWVFLLMLRFIYYVLKEYPPKIEQNQVGKDVLTTNDVHGFYLQKMKMIRKICFVTLLIDASIWDFFPLFTLLGIFPTWCVVQWFQFSQRSIFTGKYAFGQMVLHCFPPTFISSLWFVGCSFGAVPYCILWVLKDLLTGNPYP